MRKENFRLKRRGALFGAALLLVQLLAAYSVAEQDDKRSTDQQRAGTWVGSYTTEAEDTDQLTYILRQDEKGNWHGLLKHTNRDGENTAEFKLLEIKDNKFKGKADMHGGDAEVTIDGEFQPDQLSGTFAISLRGSSDIAETGTWKVTRVVAK
jgi:hypothetical protein